MQGLLSGLSARIQPLDLPAAFSSMLALETAAADLASVDAGAASPAGAPQPQRSPLDRMFEHVMQESSGNPLEPLLATPRPARTERERQDLKSRAARARAVADGEAPSSSDTAAEAAILILRLFDTNKDGAISREELLSGREKARATPEAFGEPAAAELRAGGGGPS
eukprot:COSAG03_NODE_404_length_8183_cov_12.238619_8_plen_167_part_00